MEGMDYSQKINDMRADYRSTMADQRKIHKQELEDVESRGAYKVKKQQSTYVKQKRSIEDSAKDEIGNIRKRTEKFLELKQARYRQQADKQNGQYTKTMDETSSRFNKRFLDASDAYKRSLDNLKYVNDTTQSNTKKEMAKRVHQAERNYAEAAEDVREYSDENAKNLKKGYDSSRHLYTRQTQKKFEDQNRLHSKQLQGTHERYNYKLDKLKQANTDVVNDLQEQFKIKKKIVSSKDDSALKEVVAKYEDLASDSQDMDRINAKNLASSYDNNIGTMVDQHRDQMNALKHKYHEVTTGGAQVDIAENQNDRSAKNFERRIENLREQLRDRDIRYKEHSEHLKERFRDDIQDRRDIYSGKIEEIRGDYRQYSKKLEHDFRNDQKGQQDQFRTKSSGDRRLFDQNLTDEKKESSGTIRKLKSNFGQAIHQLTEKNLAALSGLQQESSEEKKAIINGSNKKNYEDMSALRDKFDKNRTDLLKAHEEREKLSANKIVSMEIHSASKLSALKKKLGKIIKLQQASHQELRDAERNKMKNLVLGLKRDNMVAIQTQHSKFNRSMDKMKRENEKVVSDMLSGNGDKVLQLKMNHNKELRERIDSAMGKYNNFVRASELEKNQMRRQFESQMDDMRAKFQNFRNTAAREKIVS